MNAPLWRVETDIVAGTAYLHLHELQPHGPYPVTTINIKTGVNIDYDAGARPVGVEILDLIEEIPADNLIKRGIPADAVITLLNEISRALVQAGPTETTEDRASENLLPKCGLVRRPSGRW